MWYYLNKAFSNRIVNLAFLLVSSTAILLSLATYNPLDPSFNSLSSIYPTNFLGYFGSYISDALYQAFGLGSFLFPLCMIRIAINFWKLEKKSCLKYIIFTIFALISICIVASKFKFTYLPSGAAGAFGSILYPIVHDIDPRIDYLFIFTSVIFLSSLTEFKFAFLCTLIKKIFNFIPYPKIPTGDQKKSELLKKTPYLSQDEANSAPINENVSITSKEFPKKYSLFKQKPQQKSIIQNSSYDSDLSPLPTIDLLKLPVSQLIKTETSAERAKNSEMLITVLNDFGVKGQVLNISQGPVVTSYEFEPAAGTKSSRIIGLSDDIARSLSAISTRIAVIPGRNVLGIELPNKHRAFFCLRELIETKEYQDHSIMLPLILGKDLAGNPYIADLAKMPHLLVAGTTGSGKSVAINTMILSILYRYTPAECRLIMIDPKMLELSAYDGIPHLLTPVVTEPSKAVVALKWAVKEMETRYQAMSNIGVRNIAGYNAKILEAAKEGRVLEREVQTGFDHETGKPIYQRIALNMQKLPFIVVIVDEMADLMLVAGKDIELSIQRLAQMARAAGIHIIMATQRPSVDVITGVIKANFPSRISFKVTSKIDSRTILGEQGAEQLLGMGDMLYMGSSSKITRVHGPFVDDIEVEKVTRYLRSTGMPEYLSAVTEQLDEIDNTTTLSDGSSDDGLYQRALEIVRLERKVSISYIQRCLRIGYNRAATLVEKMEQKGVISTPNHVGKREILLPE